MSAAAHMALLASYSAAALKVLAYRDHKFNTSGTTSLTGFSAGPEAADRRIIIGLTGSGPSARTISSPIIGGVAADLIGQISGGVFTSCLAVALVPTGTSIDISWSLSGSWARAAAVMWSATGLTSNTPLDHVGSNALPATGTLTTLSGGFALGIGAIDLNTTHTWTNLTGRVTQTFDTGRSYSGADDVTSASSLTITDTYGGSDSDRAAYFASW